MESNYLSRKPRFQMFITERRSIFTENVIQVTLGSVGSQTQLSVVFDHPHFPKFSHAQRG